MALAKKESAFGTTEAGGYRCSCADGYIDNSSSCVAKDCGPLVDVFGQWAGSPAYGEDYKLSCQFGSFVGGGSLSETTITCPLTGVWDNASIPVCVNLWQEARDAQFNTFRFWLHAGCALLCIITAAFAAGLTMGLVSIDDFEMKLLMTTRKGKCQSDEQREKLVEDKSAAKSLLPILKSHHLLLVTLLLLNSIANEALPIFLDEILPSWAAVLVSVTCVLFFGEILPSAVFTGPSQLRMASTMAPCVRCLMVVLYPIAKPIALVLDRCIGHEAHDAKYHRAQLTAVLELHKSPKEGTYVSHEADSASSSEDSDEHPKHQSVLSCLNQDADVEHGKHSRAPCEDDLDHIECHLAQTSLHLSSVSIKELELVLAPVPAPGHPNRAAVDASPRISNDAPVSEAIAMLLQAKHGTVAVISSSSEASGGSSDLGIASFETLFRAAFSKRP